jgi:hypothetical protein
MDLKTINQPAVTISEITNKTNIDRSIRAKSNQKYIFESK